MSNLNAFKNQVRKNNPQAPAAGKPGVVGKVVISVLDNGGVNVDGFPQNPQQALSVLFAAQMAVTQYFLDAAKEGRLEGNVAEPSRIVRPGQ